MIDIFPPSPSGRDPFAALRLAALLLAVACLAVPAMIVGWVRR